MSSVHSADTKWRRRYPSTCKMKTNEVHARIEPTTRITPLPDDDSDSQNTGWPHDLRHDPRYQVGVLPTCALTLKQQSWGESSAGIIARCLEQQRSGMRFGLPMPDAPAMHRAPVQRDGCGLPLGEKRLEVASTRDTRSVSSVSDGLGYIAKVLAFSAGTQKRELLSDRKPPFAHLAPRRLALTIMKSSLVVGAPMLNEVVLEYTDEEDDDQSRSLEGSGQRGALGEDMSGLYVDGRGWIVREGTGSGRRDAREGDVMNALAKSFTNFPALAARRFLHTELAISTQRLLEWQAVVHLSARTADRLTKNIAQSAVRKTKRMPLKKAASKMTLTAARALCCQNLALFIADELFLGVRLGLRERRRRKSNPYACVDWAALLTELRDKTIGNAVFALCLWAAGTLGAVVGTMVHPKRGPDLAVLLAEMGASTLLN